MLRLITFGTLGLTNAQGAGIGGATQPRRLALLALIAAHGSRGLGRDKAVSLLWTDTDEVRARNSLSQALYALRRDLGEDALFQETPALRLNPEVIRCDLVEFQTALTEGRLAQAVDLYAGPFLDGHFLREAPEFNRWVDEMRGALTTAYTDALERLAVTATETHDHVGAVRWWRALASQDPLSSRWAVGYMRALSLSGNRAAALRHAQIHAELMHQEFEADVDESVRRLEAELRLPEGPIRSVVAASPASAAPTTFAGVGEPVAGSGEASASPESAAAERPEDHAGPAAATPGSAPRTGRRWVAAAFGIAFVLMMGWLGFHREPAVPIVAIGDLRDLTADSLSRDSTSRQSLSSLVAGLMAVGLGRAPGFHVISAERMAELMSARSVGPLAAARAAGATEMIDGYVIQLPDRTFRLDLHRVDLASGELRSVVSVNGPGMMAVVDSAVSRLLPQFGVTTPSGSVGSVTSNSVAALRLYHRGVETYFRGDPAGAFPLFVAALGEDSTFAMAAFYASRSSPTSAERRGYAARAMSLSTHVSERERLLIGVYAKVVDNSPGLVATAESLATRYPSEPDGHMDLALALIMEVGDLAGAADQYRQVLAMDRDGLDVTGTRCLACEATSGLISVYKMADSLDAAERVAREWIRDSRVKWQAYVALADVYALRGEPREAERYDSLAHEENPSWNIRQRAAERYYLAGDLSTAESRNEALLASSDMTDRQFGLWNEYLILREQGRPHAALATLGRYYRVVAGPSDPDSVTNYAPALLEDGRPATALMILGGANGIPADAIARQARNFVWRGTMRATALAALGDTSALLPLADSLRVRGMVSGFGRDHRLYHYVLGLYHESRGELDLAIDEFRLAVYSPNNMLGYRRTGYELARALLKAHRAGEATKVLQAALHNFGGVPAVTRTEIHRALGDAYAELGQADRARAEYRLVLQAWKDAEPIYHARRDSVSAALAGLSD